MLLAVIPHGSLIPAGVIEADNRVHRTALLVHHREAAFPHVGDDLGKSGGELRAATHPGDLTLAGGIVGRYHAILNPLAVLIERSVLVGGLLRPFEIRVRHRDQFIAGSLFGGAVRARWREKWNTIPEEWAKAIASPVTAPRLSPQSDRLRVTRSSRPCAPRASEIIERPLPTPIVITQSSSSSIMCTSLRWCTSNRFSSLGVRTVGPLARPFPTFRISTTQN